VNFKIALVIMLAFFIGGYLGSVVAVRVPERILKTAFGILIVLLGFRMIFKK